MAKQQKHAQLSLGELAVKNRQLTAIARQNAKPRSHVSPGTVSKDQKKQRLKLIAKGLTSMYGGGQSSPERHSYFRPPAKAEVRAPLSQLMMTYSSAENSPNPKTSTALYFAQSRGRQASGSGLDYAPADSKINYENKRRTTIGRYEQSKVE